MNAQCSSIFVGRMADSIFSALIMLQTFPVNTLNLRPEQQQVAIQYGGVHNICVLSCVFYYIRCGMSMNLGGWELEIKDMDVVFIFSLLHLAFATVNFATFAAIVAEPFLIQRSAQSTQVGIIVRIELYNSRSHFSVMLCSPGWALGLQCYT